MAIRVNIYKYFRDMKKIILLLVLIASTNGYAQKALFEISNGTLEIGTVKCTIFDSKGQEIAKSRDDNVLDCREQITEVEFIEKNELPQKRNHTFIVGNTTLQFSGKSNPNALYGRNNSKAFLKSNITLQPGDKITINNGYRDFHIQIKKDQLKKEDILKKIKVSYHKGDSIFIFKKDEPYKFNCILTLPEKIKLSNAQVFVGSRKMDISIENERFVYEINPSDIKNKESVLLHFDIDEQERVEGLKDLELEIGLVKKEPEENVWLSIIISVLIVTIFGILFFNKYKWSKKSRLLKDKNTGKKFRILTLSTPKIGDKANKKGTFVTEDNLVYVLARNGRFGKITVKSILIRIYCQDNNFFDIDIREESLFVGPRGWYKSSDGKEICITKGATATPDGIYKMNNGYVFQICSECVTSVGFIGYDKYNKSFNVILQEDKPKEGDEIIGERNRKIELGDGTVYEVANGKIAKIIKPSNEPPVAELIKKLEEANNLIQKLEERPTKEAFDELKKQFVKVEKQNREYANELENVDKVIDEAEKKARAEENRRIETKYKRIISEKYVSLEKYDEDVQELKRKKDYAINEKMKAKKEIELKEGQIKDAKDKIKELESEAKLKSEELIREKAAVAKLKEAAMKKNMHYLLQVQETLNEISESFKYVYKDIDNSVIKDGLISPMLKGVSGLSAGVLSWAEDFSVKVAEDSESFFGKDFLTMNELDVKEILAKKFISNIVKSDSFSKFVRLYQLSTVPFIRKQLVEAKMNIDMLNKLYYKVYTLVVDFGYIIVCPRLYEEQYADAKYQWFNSTNLFNVISLPEEEKQAIKAKGAEVIIDVNQIGFESPWTSRKATAVTPDF